MKKNILRSLILMLLTCPSALAQVPVNDDITGAVSLTSIVGYCSGEGQYDNINATPSGYRKGSYWNTEGKDIWFSLMATATDLSATISGRGVGTATLNSPRIAIYTYINNVLTEQIGSMNSKGNITTAYKGGLDPGMRYYLRISAEGNETGTFTLCVNNYNPPREPGQDFSSAALLCNKETFTELSVSGAGENNQEAQGSCLNTESNSAWYTWTAADDGDLSFIITPSSSLDDIDWALYDLGPITQSAVPSPLTLIRCAAGSGINCSPRYYLTGMSEHAIDINEQSGCQFGQDGFVKSINMISGHRYALLIDNFTNNSNGFTVSFGGSGNFLGPRANIVSNILNPCQSDQVYSFAANGSDYQELNWSFGVTATPTKATGLGPHLVRYSAEGDKTVILEARSDRGCSVFTSQNFRVALRPKLPTIYLNKNSLCISDTLVLSTDSIPGATYNWTGPNGFESNQRAVRLPIQALNQAGAYMLQVTIGVCASAVAQERLRSVSQMPIARFTTDPVFPAKLSAPVPIQFLNLSTSATQYEWDFGDGMSSTEQSPSHTYAKKGHYQVSLRVLNDTGCEDRYLISDLVILDEGTLTVPNSFSPNGDQFNDTFNVNIANLKRYNIDIFNRYGDKVFSSNDIFYSWDGQYRNQPVPIGAYFYTIIATDLFGKSLRKSGSITLVR